MTEIDLFAAMNGPGVSGSHTIETEDRGHWTTGTNSRGERELVFVAPDGRRHGCDRDQLEGLLYRADVVGGDPWAALLDLVDGAHALYEAVMEDFYGVHPTHDEDPV